ncbi:MAG TPA: DoxX family protein [Bryobacteraceae bacterium]|nr:DoxX family protein [Bryobacteraceae bacterium]
MDVGQGEMVDSDLRLVPEEARSRQDVIITWILRLAVAAMFISIGRSKFDASSMWIKLFEQIGFGQWFRRLTGTLQIAGAILVLIPRTFVIGIALLACTMAGAAVIWIVRLGAPANAIIPMVVLAGLIGVGLHGARVDRSD